MRRTKIVATLGPSTDDPEIIEALIAAGTNVVRVNFSHGKRGDHERQIAAVRKVAADLGRSVAILGDLQGPKIRISSFRGGAVQLKEGQPFALDVSLDSAAGNEREVGVLYEDLPKDVGAGDTLLLDDGSIVLDVKSVAGKRIECVVKVGGKLANKKGINRQGGGLSAPALTNKDLDDIKRAAAVDVDWLAVSFVKQADDVERAREYLRAAGGRGHIVAKIERTEAMDNLNSIIDASDAVMVARGDLGVEMGYAGLAGFQKRIIRLTRLRHKVSITATQMMESMISNQMPTRAEVSDVANAVMDGTDAVMLSAETAIGQFPVKAVTAMSDVCTGAEVYHHSVSRMSRHRMDDRFSAVDEAIAMAVMYTANHLDVQAIIALTESGSTALWMSRIRSDIPIFAFTPHEATQRRVALYRGVYPVAFNIADHGNTREVFNDVCELLTKLDHVKADDLVILTKGQFDGVSGATNEMRILRVTGQ